MNYRINMPHMYLDFTVSHDMVFTSYSDMDLNDPIIEPDVVKSFLYGDMELYTIPWIFTCKGMELKVKFLDDMKDWEVFKYNNYYIVDAKWYGMTITSSKYLIDKYKPINKKMASKFMEFPHIVKSTENRGIDIYDNTWSIDESRNSLVYLKDDFSLTAMTKDKVPLFNRKLKEFYDRVYK